MSNKQVEFEITNTNTLVPQNETFKYKFNKICTDRNEENNKTLIKKIKELNWKIFHGHGLEDSILSRCQFFPHQSMDLTQSQSKSQQLLSQFPDLSQFTDPESLESREVWVPFKKDPSTHYPKFIILTIPLAFPKETYNLLPGYFGKVKIIRPLLDS